MSPNATPTGEPDPNTVKRSGVLLPATGNSKPNHVLRDAERVFKKTI